MSVYYVIESLYGFKYVAYLKIAAQLLFTSLKYIEYSIKVTVIDGVEGLKKKSC